MSRIVMSKQPGKEENFSEKNGQISFVRTTATPISVNKIHDIDEYADLPAVKENPSDSAEKISGQSVKILFGNTESRREYYAPTHLLHTLPPGYPITGAIDLLLKFLEGLQECRKTELANLESVQQLREKPQGDLNRQWEVYMAACAERDKALFKFTHKKTLTALQTGITEQIKQLHGSLNRLSVSNFPPPETVPVDQAFKDYTERLDRCQKSHEETLHTVQTDIRLCQLRLKELVDQYFDEAEKIDSKTWELCLANQQIYELHWQIINFIKDLEPDVADQ